MNHLNRILRWLWLRLRPQYRVLERTTKPWKRAKQMITEGDGKSAHLRWTVEKIRRLRDGTFLVYLWRRERIWE